MTDPSPLDPTDRLLLQALQQDARQRLEDLAKLVRLAPSSVHDRLRRLERDGVLRRWTIELDHAAVGLGVLAFVGVRATKSCSALMPAFEKVAAIEECHSVAGELSMLLKVRVADTPALLHFVESLRQIPGIEQTETTVVLQTQIERPIPLAPPTTPAKGRR